MAEQLINDFTVNLPVDEAWQVLTDIERIAPCLPGAELHEIVAGADGASDVYRGVVKIKLGSIAPQFKGQAEFIERDDAEHRAVIRAEGRDTGNRGTASADITAGAESLSPTSTRVTVTTELKITGKVAQFSRGIIGDVSRKLMEQFSGNLNEMLDQGTTAEPASTAEIAGTAATPSPADTAGASNSATATSAPSTSTATTATSTTETPLVRKIDGPASEPVDLAGVAGPAILKRLAPVLAVLTLVFVLLRKRR